MFGCALQCYRSPGDRAHLRGRRLRLRLHRHGARRLRPGNRARHDQGRPRKRHHAHRARRANCSIPWWPACSTPERRALSCRASRIPSARRSPELAALPAGGQARLRHQRHHDRLRVARFAEIIEHLNRNTLAVVQFETVTAIERADELLSVKGLDIVMVGPADLSISLGIAGQFDNPLSGRSRRPSHREVPPARRVPGIQTRSVAMAKFWAARGMRFVGASAEHALLLEKARESVADLRSVAGPRSA